MVNRTLALLVVGRDALAVERVRPGRWMGSADERVRPYLDAVWAQPEREAIFLAEDGGEAIGFARVTLTDDGPCPARLETLFVRPERRGIGRQLLERALGWCAEHGADAVALDVLPGNVDAARFYERLGWRVSCPRRGR